MTEVVLLVSTYDLGRQPFGLASAAAALRGVGLDVECVDLSRTKLVDETIRRASAVAFFLPMHTATRLAMPVIDRVRALNPDARLAAYGLYAPLNAALLREHGVSIVRAASSRTASSLQSQVLATGQRSIALTCLVSASASPIVRDYRR